MDKSICPRCKKETFIKLSTESICFSCGYEKYLIQEESDLNTVSAQVDAQDGVSKIKYANKLALNKFYYHLHKDDSNEGIKYLKDNRKLSDETIEKFKLGFAPKHSAGVHYKLADKGFTKEEMFSTGLVGEGKSLYDKFWNRVMFPIFDVNNVCIGFGGRTLGDDKPKYVNSPETKLFKKKENLFALNFAKEDKKDFFILCEGYMDVIALHQAGITNAIAALGTALTIEQACLMKKFKNTVYISFDSDDAGIKATKRAIPILSRAGLNIKIINFAPYKDPDEFIKDKGVQEFKKRIYSAVSADKFLINLSDEKEERLRILKLAIQEQIKEKK